MTSFATDLEQVELAKGHEPKIATPVYEKQLDLGTVSANISDSALLRQYPEN